MNLPNKLTIARVLLIPLCLLMLYLRWDVVAGILFLVACFTDFLDGQIARKQGIVTNFGKFADPVADKILVLSAMVLLVNQRRFPWWALVIVLMRELAIDGLRLVALDKGIVIAAGVLGKAKTVVQMIAVLSAIWLSNPTLTILLAVLVSILTLASGYAYFAKAGYLLNPIEKK